MSDSPAVYTFEWARARKLVLKSIVAAVIAAALIAIYAVIVGEFNILEGKLLVLVGIFVAFTLMSLFDAEVVSKTHESFALVGVLVNVYLLLGGALKIMLSHANTTAVTSAGFSTYSEAGALNKAFWYWVLMVILARAALGLAMLVKAEGAYYRYNALQGLIWGTNIMVTILTALLSFMLLFDNIDYADAYWRIIGVAVILVVLGMVLIPLIGRFFGERLPRPVPVRPQTTFPGVRNDVPVTQATAADNRTFGTDPGHLAADTLTGTNVDANVTAEPEVKPVTKRLAWPRFEDGTPLPQGPDGKPDYSVLNQ